MGILVGLLFLALVVGLVVVYLRLVSGSRHNMDQLYEPPDDLRRADDNQQPPADGSAGLV